MSVIIIPRNINRRPNGRLKPGRRGLVLALDPLFPWNSSVSGEPSNVVGPGPASAFMVGGTAGPMLRMHSSGVGNGVSGLRFGRNTEGADFTVVWRGVITSVSSIADLTICSRGHDSFGAGRNVIVDFSTGSNLRVRVITAVPAVHTLNVAVPTIAVGETHTLVVSKSGPQLSAYFLSGKSSGTITAGDGSLRQSSVGWAVANGGVSASEGVHDCALFAILRDGVSSGDAWGLAENPWQLFRADPVRIYSIPSAGFPISINVAASNLTATGARITATLGF